MNDKEVPIKQPSENKSCSACAHEIPIKAVKCVHCGSFQNWRRFLDVGNTSLTLFVTAIALFGVIAVKFDAVTSYFSDRTKFGSNIVRAIDNINTETLTILYTNQSKEQIFIENEILCRIPIIRLDSAYVIEMNKTIPPIIGRYPNPSEVDTLSLGLYSNGGGIRILEPNSSASITYYIDQRFPESKRGFNEEAKEISGYCQINIKNIYGDNDMSFNDIVKIPKLELMLIQDGLRSRPKFDLKENHSK